MEDAHAPASLEDGTKVVGINLCDVLRGAYKSLQYFHRLNRLEIVGRYGRHELRCQVQT